MEYNKPIAQMQPGDNVEGFYILKKRRRQDQYQRQALSQRHPGG